MKDSSVAEAFFIVWAVVIGLTLFVFLLFKLLNVKLESTYTILRDKYSTDKDISDKLFSDLLCRYYMWASDNRRTLWMVGADEEGIYLRSFYSVPSNDFFIPWSDMSIRKFSGVWLEIAEFSLLNCPEVALCCNKKTAMKLKECSGGQWLEK